MQKRKSILILCLCVLVFVALLFYLRINNKKEIEVLDTNVTNSLATPILDSEEFYKVIKVVDGDTLDLEINDKTERVRLIGIDTPETVDPRKPVECFGKEASNKAKLVLSGKEVKFESDSTQDVRDKYGRLLGYVFLADGSNFNQMMIEEGFAYEYTYHLAYKYQEEFKSAQKEAEDYKKGLWADGVCTDKTPRVDTSKNGECSIKGNISVEGEKIYHISSCDYYTKTVISESAGEKWFCTEQEAIDAGWRKALNCN